MAQCLEIGTYVTTDLTVITGTVLTGTVITETGIKQCGNQVGDQINTFLSSWFKQVSHVIKLDGVGPVDNRPSTD